MGIIARIIGNAAVFTLCCIGAADVIATVNKWRLAAIAQNKTVATQ